MNKILIVVDMQNDFIDGSLGTDAAKEIVDNVCDKIEEIENSNNIIMTFDTHDENYFNTLEGEKLPIKHCIKHSTGWCLNPKICEALDNYHQKYVAFDKSSFSNVKMIEVVKERFVSNDDDNEIEIVGLCTDICVISNALMLRSAFPNTPITVYADCCAGTTPEKHEAALEVMRSCQIDIDYIERKRKDMSYDLRFAVKADIGGENRYVVIGEPDHANPTYNLRKIFTTCTGWDYKIGTYYKCSEIIDKVQRGIKELSENPLRYKKYEPKNGWGTIDNALDCLDSIRYYINRLSSERDVPLDYLYIAW